VKIRIEMMLLISVGILVKFGSNSKTRPLPHVLPLVDAKAFSLYHSPRQTYFGALSNWFISSLAFCNIDLNATTNLDSDLSLPIPTAPENVHNDMTCQNRTK